MTATTLGSRAGRYLRDAATGIRRAPAEVLATLAVAVAFSWAVEDGDTAFQEWAELAVSCLLLLTVAWTGTLLEARGVWDARRRWAVTVGGGAVVAIYANAVADFTYAAEAWRGGLLVLAAAAWLFALPAVAGPSPGRVDRMRRIDGRILLRMIGALLYGGALFAGLALALRAVDSLFELDLDEEIYGHVFGWIFFALVPWIVIGGLPDYVRPDEETNSVAGVAQRIVSYLVPPLLALYYLILYAYVIRIVVTAEIPKNLVSPLVLAAGGLATLALLLFDPRPGHTGLARWLRLAPPLFAPLAVLGAWALLLRTGQYGLTEFRLVRLAALVALFALAVGATAQLVRRRPFSLHLAPLGIAAVLLVMAVGPWSVMSLSRHSQEERLEAALDEVGIAPGDVAHLRTISDSTVRVVRASAYEQIRGSARYLAGHFGPDALPPVLRELLAGEEDARWVDHAALLGLQPDAPAEGERMSMGGSLPLNAPFEMLGGTAYRINVTPDPRVGPRVGPSRGAGTQGELAGGIVTSFVDSTRIALRLGDRVLHAELAPLVAGLHPFARPARDPWLPLDEAVVPLTDTAGAPRGQLIVWTLWMDSDSTGRRIGHVEGLVFVAD